MPVNTVDFTLRGLDLLDADQVEVACGILRARHRQALMERSANGEPAARATIAARPTANLMPTVDAPPSDPTPTGPFQGQTRAFLDRMVDTIRNRGSVTLEAVAVLHGIEVETARAYIRNAGRTAKAHGIAMPVVPTWDAGLGCNVYGF